MNADWPKSIANCKEKSDKLIRKLRKKTFYACSNQFKKSGKQLRLNSAEYEFSQKQKELIHLISYVP